MQSRAGRVLSWPDVTVTGARCGVDCDHYQHPQVRYSRGAHSHGDAATRGYQHMAHPPVATIRLRDRGSGGESPPL